MNFLSNRTIVALFEEQVDKTPENIAVIFEEQQLTYRELNSKANQLAHYLQTYGVKPEVLVGICVGRSLEMIVGLLGVLKAGAAYVPLDPAYPAERLIYMLNDAKVSVLLTQQKSANMVSEHPLQVVCLDTQWAVISEQNAENPVNEVQANNLAYVIYTSGSTGKPKGVMIEHHSLTDFISAIIIEYGLSARDRVLQFASISFDASVEEIYPCLICGGTLVLRNDELLRSVSEFVQKSKKWKLTVWPLPTAYWHLVTQELANGIKLPESLRLVVIGGERVLPEPVSLWHKCVGDYPQLINIYGPTETTVGVTIYKSSSLSAAQRNGQEVPIGRPLEHVQLHVLDQNLKPVSAETLGELYIGGNCLARGYLNNPELTSEKFITHPDAPNARLYKTGDSVRYQADGNLEFLGRIDHQVKIQGFRIEPGEIETVLTSHPLVSQAVVIVREDTPNDKRLVAYVVPKQTLEAGTSVLHRFLKEKLPHYMVPAAFVILDRLPLTPTHKIDRQALPAPEKNRPFSPETFVAPRNRTEEQVAAIWAEILGLEQIGTQDDLFELGGHSLIAGQILARVRDVFQVELPLSSVFEHPVIADFAKFIEQHVPKAQPLQRSRIQPIPRDGDLPVSFAQERVYFIQQLSPSITAYQFQENLCFNGHLDIEALEQSLNEIVRRHEIFRTTFPAVAGRLLQVIHPAQPISLPVFDLQTVPESEREAEVQRLTDKAVQQPFFLHQLPLIRWTLLKLSEQEHVMIHVEHHLVHDGWSFNLFLRELLALYQAFSQGKSSPFTEAPPQFADFAHWQRQWVQSKEAQQQLDYWTQQLADSPPLLELPNDRPRPAEPAYQGDLLRMDLPLELCNSLRSLGRQEKVTLFMTLFAAFLTLLHRYTGQDDLCVGSGVANRRMREIEGMIGMVVNNIVLRTNLSGNPSFQALLAQVRQVTLEGYANEDLPFDKVVEALKPVRNLSYNPLFQVMFSFHDAQLPELSLPGLDIKLREAISNQSAKFDLDVVAIPRSEQRVSRTAKSNSASLETQGITLVWEYSSDLFDATSIQRMMGQYQTLLEGIVANPTLHLSELPLLTAAQKQQLLADWNATQTSYPDQCHGVHQLFEAQVTRTPNAIAVAFEQQQLTYQALNAKANQLAHHLQSLGVGPDILVAICMERSLELIVGLLGILKAGGASVSLDPAYPAERLSYMLNDSQAPVLLMQPHLAGIETERPVPRVYLDPQWQTIAQQSAENPVTTVQANHLAYVIYTSGSAGEPKGVLIEHQSLMNFTQAAIAEYQITANDRVLQFASTSFDAAAEEIYPCLSQGGMLVLRTEPMMRSVPGFVQTSKDLKLTIWDLPTAYWHLIITELSNGNIALPDTLRLVIIGGERVLPERVAQWQQCVGPAPLLINTYGPTEATVVATWCLLSDTASTSNQEIPIGHPIANVQAYILDQYRQPVPIGVAGELHLGGAGLARGYLNRPELTTEKFIFCNAGRAERSETRQTRLYKTGDLARYRPDGQIEFLGRIDTQVKIRGLRIELGEIETVLNQHPKVSLAVVIAREDVPGNKRLVAYFAAKHLQTSADELRHALKQKLPDYMVPAIFVMLDALPMTPSGKVDRKALPLPDTSHNSLDAGFVAPRNPTEEGLAAIWAEVLRLEQVSIHDNFFELGGDSIISIQMISRANQAGLQFTPKQLFQHQTIAGLAAVAGTAIRSIQAQQDQVTGPVPLTPIQHWFFEQDFPEPHCFNQSAQFEVPSDANPELLRQVVQHLIYHHDALRLRFVQQNNRLQQINALPDDNVPFHVIDLSEFSSEEQASAIKADDTWRQAGLNLAEGPIVCVVLFVLGMNQPSRLLFIVHHLAVDGISWRILLEDFTTANQQLGRGEAIQLPPKTTAFQQWANRLNEYAHTLTTELDAWLPESGLNLPTLPIDYPDESAHNTLISSALVTHDLTEAETHALLQDVPAAYNTQINDVLLTALVQSLAPWTGVQTLMVDLEGHGREDLFEDIDLSRTVGWFTTLFPVCLTLASIDSPFDALKSIKEQLRRIPKRGIGYGVLRYLSQEAKIRDKCLARPKAEISFNYLGQFDQVLSAAKALGNMIEWKSEHSRQGNRSHLLAVSGLISAGKLEIAWNYSANLHRRDTIEHLASQFMAALRTLIAHCQSPETGGYTPSDFSAAKLSQKRLDKLMAKVNKR